jgi:hypothetical protein
MRNISNAVIKNKVAVVTSGASYTVDPLDDVVIVNKETGSATTVTLPASPTVGEVVTVKDGKGDAATNNVTVAGNGKNIDGAASYVLNNNYGAVSLVYNGTQWNNWSQPARLSAAVVG